MARQHGMTPEKLKGMLLTEWRFIGRPKQQPPPAPWTYWWVNAGRGFGKTLTGAQWAKNKAMGAKTRGAVIAPTLGDIRRTCFEGETGLLSVLPNDALLGQSRSVAWNKSLLELTLANGTIITGFSSEEPDRLRGPQHHWVWGEEVSSWKDAHRPPSTPETTWQNMNLGMRLGDAPQACLTSTPKVNKLTLYLAALAAQGRLVMVRGSSYENRVNLSEAWWEAVVAPLEGTRTGMQEIHAALLDDVEGALWTRALLDSVRIVPGSEPTMKRVIVAVDPQGSTDEASNEAGIIVVGKGHDSRGYVLADRTPRERGPWVWGKAAVDAYHEFAADRVVAETNFGAAMVEFVIKAVDPTVAFKAVTASRGKRPRAEPIATLYGTPPGAPEGFVKPSMVSHVGVFEELETEQVTWTPDAESPNRMDALVWGLTELKIWMPVSANRARASRGRIPLVGDRGGFGV